MNLNENQQRVLEWCRRSSEGNGYDFGLTEDVVADGRANGMRPQQVGAYITQLEQAGFFEYIDSDGVTTCSGHWHQFGLSPKASEHFGYRVHNADLDEN